jgi:DNA-binding transcriptional regulator YiaG
VLSHVCTAIVRLLDHHLLPAATTLPVQLVQHRATLEMSQEETAKRLGVDPGTLARWGRGEREPAGSLLGRAERFLAEAEVGLGARRVG